MKAQQGQWELQLAAAEAEQEVWAGSAVVVGTEPKRQGVVLKVEDLRLNAKKKKQRKYRLYCTDNNEVSLPGGKSGCLAWALGMGLGAPGWVSEMGRGAPG